MHGREFIQHGLNKVLTMIWQWNDWILGFKGQRLRSPHDQIWAKIQLWSCNSTLDRKHKGFKDLLFCVSFEKVFLYSCMGFPQCFLIHKIQQKRLFYSRYLSFGCSDKWIHEFLTLHIIKQSLGHTNLTDNDSFIMGDSGAFSVQIIGTHFTPNHYQDKEHFSWPYIWSLPGLLKFTQ